HPHTSKTGPQSPRTLGDLYHDQRRCRSDCERHTDWHRDWRSHRHCVFVATKSINTLGDPGWHSVLVLCDLLRRYPEGRRETVSHTAKHLCSMTALSPNQALQRTGTHKVLGRGRSRAALWPAPRARVLKRPRAVAELSS